MLFCLLSVIPLLISRLPLSDCKPNGDPLDDTPLVFSQQPADEYYVAMHHAALIECKAGPVLQLLVRCDERWLVPESLKIEQYHETTSDSSTATGNFYKTSVNVTKEMVEDGSSDGFYCECSAIYGEAGKPPRTVKSKKTRVYIATLENKFEQEPLNTNVPLQSSILLQCSPPAGSPPPKISWLKDSQLIDPSLHEFLSFIISSEGNLIVSQARLEDSGDYECVAENMAGRRVSGAAVVNVFVNGGWTEWSEWSVCQGRCGSGKGGSQTRRRECTQPPPLSGGTPCFGEAVHKVPCQVDCSVDGHWSVWSVWSVCGVDCQRHRRRFCDNPFPDKGGLFCDGNNVESEACYGGNCHLENFGGYDVYYSTPPSENSLHHNFHFLLLLPLFVLFIVLFTVVMVVCWKKIKKSERNGKCEQGVSQVSNLLLKPDITKSLNDEASVNNNNNNNTNNNNVFKNNNYNLSNNYVTTSINSNSYNENNITINNSGFFVPTSNNNNNNNSAKTANNNDNDNNISPSCSIQSNNTDNTNLLSESQTTYCEVQNNINNNNKMSVDMKQKGINYNYNYAFNNNNKNKESIALTTGTITTNKNNGNNLYNDYNSDDYSNESKNNSLESPLYAKYSIDPLSVLLANQASANVCLESLACMMIDEFGGMLTEPSSGLSLLVPEGAVERGEIMEFFVGVSRDDKDRPRLHDSQTLLSDVIVCGPINVKLLKPCIITLPHCAQINNNINNYNNTNNNKNNNAHGNWNIGVYNSPLNYLQYPPYQKIYQLPSDNNSNNNSNSSNNNSYNKNKTNKLSVHLDKTNCHIMISSLGQFCLIGEKNNSANQNNASSKTPNHAFPPTNLTNDNAAMASKRLRLAVYAPMVSPSVEVIIRAYFVADTPDAIKGVELMERGLSGRSLAQSQVMAFHHSHHNLCIRLEALSSGWECKLQNNCQEIPFSHVWNNTQSLMHCSLTLQSTHPSSHPSSHSSSHPSISFSLQIFQKDQLEDMNLFHVCHNISEGMASSIISHQLPTNQDALSSDGDDDDTYTCLCGGVKRMVCGHLDAGAEWKKMASLMKQESHLEFFSSTPSPTETLLNLWQVRCANNNKNNKNNNNENNKKNDLELFSNSGLNGKNLFISTLVEFLRVMQKHALVKMVENEAKTS